jgi:hypothetical protein
MRKLVVALAALSTVAALPAPAGAVDLYTITGEVRDPLGRLLPGATVRDEQNKSATADSNGRYALPEAEARKYVLKAQRSDTDAVSAPVTLALGEISKTQDFTLPYKLSASLAKSALSARSGPATLALTVSTGAAEPGLPGQAGKSCVKVRDSRTGLVHDATYNTTTGSGAAIAVYWAKSLEVPQGTTEGSFSLSSWAEDCATGAKLSKAPGFSSSYTVDNTPPWIPRDGLVPADGSNSAYSTGQALVATVKDNLSGVAGSSVTFHLYDAEDNEVFRSGGGSATTRVTFNSLTGQAVARPPVVLEQGKTYFTTVVARDEAGNEATMSHTEALYGGGFTVTSLQAESTDASIAATTCTISSQSQLGGPYAGMREVTCPDVKVHLDDANVSMEGMRHIDSGYVSHTFALNAATLVGDLYGQRVTYPAYRNDHPDWAPKTRSMLFTYGSSSSRQVSAHVPAQDAVLGTLVTYVPAAWRFGEAKLEMPKTPTNPSTRTCSDPSTSLAAVKCSPDPLDARFVVQFGPAVDAAAEVARHRAEHRVQVRGLLEKGYSGFVPPEAWAAIAADPDVVSIRREPLGRELAPDDWADNAPVPDTEALTPQIRSTFGARFGGDWIDRSVVPAEWRVAVKDATPDDHWNLFVLAGGSHRVVIKPVAHSEADFASYMATADSVLRSHGVQPRGMIRDYPAQVLRVDVAAITTATESALKAALPAGVPVVRVVAPSSKRLAHRDSTEGLPIEGGQLVTTVVGDPADMNTQECTVAFAVKRTVDGTTEYGGATAGHCAARDNRARFANALARDLPYRWSGWYDAAHGDRIASDGAVFDGVGRDDVTKQIFTDPLDKHRTISGKFAHDGIKMGQKACNQGQNTRNTSITPTNPNGVYDNCGQIRYFGEDVPLGDETDLRFVARSWCFGPALATPGDSGGPVYATESGQVKMMGLLSYIVERTTHRVGVPHSTNGADGGTTQAPPVPEPVITVPQPPETDTCFTSVVDFETASGWQMHR